MVSAETAAGERSDLTDRPEIRDEAPPVVSLPDQFLAYVEILQLADPEAHADLSRELAEAEPGPALEEEAAHQRRARMLDSLAAEISAASPAEPARGDFSFDAR